MLGQARRQFDCPAGIIGVNVVDLRGFLKRHDMPIKEELL